jgi:colanic acid/amylovoran biosynthesis protein
MQGDSMIIEVQGVNFINKGAELMLHAVLQHYKNGENIVAANLRCGNFKQRADAGLYHIMWADIVRAPITGPVLDSITRVVPKVLRQRLSLVRDSEVNAVLDASGFAFSDQRGVNPSVNMANRSQRWKSQGKKVVLLPQAFGPFEIKVIRDSVLRILDHADLIFARDRISYDYLVDLAGISDKIKLAPDFTNLVTGQIPPYWNPKSNAFCIIPNYRMIDKTTAEVRDSYLPFLETCIRYLLERGIRPFILIHETKQDYQLAVELQKRLQQELTVIQEENPLYVKGIIGSCSAVISSRFHGLVNALSQGVPSLATGWSHKYQMLLDDYLCPDCFISNQDSRDEIVCKVAKLIDEPDRGQILSRLHQAGMNLKNETIKMWAEVDSVIGAN